MVPFLIVIIVTFVGMILGGYYAIRGNNKDPANQK